VTVPRQGSASIEHPDYWWYRARADLLQAALRRHLGRPRRVLDVGSADGPSVSWMRGDHHQVAVDVDTRGLRAGEGVQASAMALPFRDATFDVVAAFDVLEHCDPESRALQELRRVLVPGGHLLMSVPAYQWAWTDHDVAAGHHRRYTRTRLVAAVQGAGFEVLRCTHGFAAVFPLFVAERLVRRAWPTRGGAGALPQPSAGVERLLLGLCGAEARWLRRWDLPFGSSILLAARQPV